MNVNAQWRGCSLGLWLRRVVLALLVFLVFFEVNNPCSISALQEALAPYSRFQTKRAAADKTPRNVPHAALRLPTVRPVEGMALSLDKGIQRAQDRGQVEQVAGRDLEFILHNFESSVMNSPNLELFLRNALSQFRRLFPNAKADITTADLRHALIQSLALFRDGKLGLWVDKSSLERPEQETVWGYRAESGEIATDSGKDAANLPFLVRRIGNRLYMKEKFFTTFSRMNPDQSSVFWEAFLHDALEDPEVSSPLGIAPEKAHAFASMMTEAALCDHSVPTTVGDFASGYRTLHQWIVQFYTPEQLADFLRYHPGVQAASWRERSLHILLRLREVDLLHDALQRLRADETGFDPAEKEWREDLLEGLKQRASGEALDSPSNLVLAKLGIASPAGPAADQVDSPAGSAVPDASPSRPRVIATMDLESVLRTIWDANQRNEAPFGIDLRDYAQRYPQNGIYYLIRDLERHRDKLGLGSQNIGPRVLWQALKVCRVPGFKDQTLSMEDFLKLQEILKTAHAQNDLSRYGDLLGMIDLAGHPSFAPKGLNLGNLYNTVGKPSWLAEVLEIPQAGLPPWQWEKISLPYTTFLALKGLMLEAHKGKVLGMYASAKAMIKLAANSRFGRKGLDLANLHSGFGTREKVAKILQIPIEEVPREWGWRQISLSRKQFKAAKAILLEAHKKDRLSEYAGVSGMIELAAQIGAHLHHLYAAFGKGPYVAEILEIPEGKIPPWTWENSHLPINRALQWLDCIVHLKGFSGDSYPDIASLVSKEAAEKERKYVEMLIQRLTSAQRQGILNRFGSTLGIRTTARTGPPSAAPSLSQQPIPAKDITEVIRSIRDANQQGQTPHGMDLRAYATKYPQNGIYYLIRDLEKNREKLGLGSRKISLGAIWRALQILDVPGFKSQYMLTEEFFTLAEILKDAHKRRDLAKHASLRGMIDLAGDRRFGKHGLNLAHLYNVVGQRPLLAEILEVDEKSLPPWNWKKISLSYASFTAVKELLLQAHRDNKLGEYASLSAMMELAADQRFGREGLNLANLYSAFGNREKVAEILGVAVDTVPREWNWVAISLSPEKFKIAKGILLKAYQEGRLAEYADVRGMLDLAASVGTNLHHLHVAFGDPARVAEILGVAVGKMPEWKWKSSTMPIERALHWIYCLQNLKGFSGNSYPDVKSLVSGEVQADMERRGVTMLIEGLSPKERQQLLGKFETAFGIESRTPTVASGPVAAPIVPNAQLPMRRNDFTHIIRMIREKNQKGEVPFGIDLGEYPKQYPQNGIYYLLRDLKKNRGNLGFGAANLTPTTLWRALERAGIPGYRAPSISLEDFNTLVEILESASKTGDLPQYGNLLGMIRLAGNSRFGPDGLHLGRLYNVVGRREWLGEILGVSLVDLTPWKWAQISMQYAKLQAVKKILKSSHDKGRLSWYASIRGMLVLSQQEGLSPDILFSGFGTRERVATILEIDEASVPPWNWLETRMSLPEVFQWFQYLMDLKGPSGKAYVDLDSLIEGETTAGRQRMGVKALANNLTPRDMKEMRDEWTRDSQIAKTMQNLLPHLKAMTSVHEKVESIANALHNQHGIPGNVLIMRLLEKLKWPTGSHQDLVNRAVETFIKNGYVQNAHRDQWIVLLGGQITHGAVTIEPVPPALFGQAA